MNRREFLEATVAGTAAIAVSDSLLFSETLVAGPAPQTHPRKEQVDFGYAFAPPHRMTVARPEASEKTLLDLQSDFLTMTWSYGNLRTEPLCVFKTPQIAPWRIRIQPLFEGKPFRLASGAGCRPQLAAPGRNGRGSRSANALRKRNLRDKVGCRTGDNSRHNCAAPS
jgi:hypothetical protein